MGIEVFDTRRGNNPEYLYNRYPEWYIQPSILRQIPIQEIGRLIPHDVTEIHFPFDGKNRYNSAIDVIDGKITVFARAQADPSTRGLTDFVKSEVEAWQVFDGRLQKVADIADNAEDPALFTNDGRILIGRVGTEGIAYDPTTDTYNGSIRTVISELNDDLTLGKEVWRGMEGRKDQRFVELPNGKVLALFRVRDVTKGEDGVEHVSSSIYARVTTYDELENNHNLENETTTDPKHLLIKFASDEWGGPNVLSVVDTPEGPAVMMLMHFAHQEDNKRIYFSGIGMIALDKIVAGEKEVLIPRFTGVKSLLPSQEDMGIHYAREDFLSNVVFGSGLLFIKCNDGTWDMAIMAGVGDAKTYVLRQTLPEGFVPNLNVPGAMHRVTTEADYDEFIRIAGSDPEAISITTRRDGFDGVPAFM